jgi:D-amino-acid dehydrogenase
MKDPYKLVTAPADRFTALGGRIETGDGAGFPRSGRITGVTLSNGRQIAADAVVIAAGAHSARLARTPGEPIPLETERG